MILYGAMRQNTVRFLGRYLQAWTPTAKSQFKQLWHVFHFGVKPALVPTISKMPPTWQLSKTTNISILSMCFSANHLWAPNTPWCCNSNSGRSLGQLKKLASYIILQIHNPSSIELQNFDVLQNWLGTCDLTGLHLEVKPVFCKTNSGLCSGEYVPWIGCDVVCGRTCGNLFWWRLTHTQIQNVYLLFRIAYLLLPLHHGNVLWRDWCISVYNGRWICHRQNVLVCSERNCMWISHAACFSVYQFCQTKNEA